MLTLRLKPSLERRLEELARRTGRTKTFYAARAIEQSLPEFEETYASVEIPKVPIRNAQQVKRAIATLKSLRKGVTKPGDLTVTDMREKGRS